MHRACVYFFKKINSCAALYFALAASAAKECFGGCFLEKNSCAALHFAAKGGEIRLQRLATNTYRHEYRQSGYTGQHNEFGYHQPPQQRRYTDFLAGFTAAVTDKKYGGVGRE